MIVGRASQCILRNNPRALHVLVYAPVDEKIERVKQRHPHEHDLPALMHRMDAERHHYINDYYGCDSYDRAMYHLCLNSTIGIDTCAALIVSAIHQSEKEQKPKKQETSV